MSDSDFESWIYHSSKAIESDRIDVLRQALKFSAQFNKNLLSVIVENGNTLLHLACKADRADAVRILLQAGADPCVQNAEGHLPMELCSTEDVRHAFVMDCVQAIHRCDQHRMLQHLAAGVPVNASDSPLTANTLLHWAAFRGSLECLQALLAREADVNVCNANGLTPLHEALLQGHRAVLEELLEHGADPKLSVTSGRHAGKSALALCRELRADLLPLFVTAGQRNELPSTPLTRGSWDGPDHLSLTANSECESEEERWPGEDAERLQWEGAREIWPSPRGLQLLEGLPLAVSGETALRLVVCGAAPPEELARADRVLQLLTADLQSHGFVVQRQERQTHSLRLPPHLPATLELGQQVVPGQGQAYQILVANGKVRVQSATAIGLRYGCLTLVQLLTASSANAGLPPMKIVDWPGSQDRGVLVDLSTGLLPRRDRLLQWIEALARSKCNQVHLFVRVSAGGEVIRGYDFGHLAALCDACRALFIEPILALDIAATVESLDDLQPEMMDRLMSCFPADSPLHVGPRLSLHLLQALSEAGGVSLPCWLDLRSRPRVGLCPSSADDAERMWNIAALPIVAMEYIVPGYHEWKKKRDFFRRQGVPFCVCLGASSVTSITGCLPRALPDLLPTLHGLQDPLTSSLCGVISCQWSGPFPLSQPVFAMPAHLIILGLAWNFGVEAQTAMSRVRCQALPAMFGDDDTVKALLQLARLEMQLLPIDAAPYTCLLSAASTDLQSAVSSLLEHNAAGLKTVFHESRALARRLERKDANKDSMTNLLAFVARLLEFSCRLAFLHSPDHSPLSRSTVTTRTDLANRIIVLVEEAKQMGERWFAMTDRGRGAIGACFRSLLNQILPDQSLSELSRQLQEVSV